VSSQIEPYVPTIGSDRPGRLRPRRVARYLERRRFLARAPADALSSPDLELTRQGGTYRLVRLQPGVLPAAVQQANLQRIVEVCEAQGIDHFVVPAPPAHQPRVGVAAPDWERLVDALVELASRQPLYAGVAARTPSGERRRWPALLSMPEVVRAARTQKQLEVFEMVAPARGARPYDRPYACLVERWEPDELDGLRAPSVNQRATYVRGAAREAVSRTVGGTEMRSLRAFEHPDVFDIDFPVDVVYLWVDGSDRAWQERKRAALARQGVVVPPVGSADERFRDHGELRYSFRSIDRFAPWVRNIYLVSDQQVPGWLDVNHPRIRLVDHQELFGDEGTAPTFNSHALGARLHRIEGLSEHYLYLNDDVFLGRLLGPSTFFHANGMPKFFLSRSTLPMTEEDDAAPHEQARRNVAELLQRDFGRLPGRTFFHTPIPQRRSLLTELEQRYPNEFSDTWHSQFRSGSDHEVNWWLHAYYGYLTGRAVPGSIRYDYFNLGLEGTERRMARLLARRDLQAFCINDTAEATHAQHEVAAAWLAAYYPGPAAWEKAEEDSAPPQAPKEDGGARGDRRVATPPDLSQG